MAKGNARDYDLELSGVTTESKALLNERREIQAMEHLSPELAKRLEEIRVKINQCRKDERFLRNRIKSIKGEL